MSYSGLVSYVRISPNSTNPRYRSIKKIVIHHTGNPYDDDLSVKTLHVSHRAQGWAGIGYHFVIRKDGSIEIGRPDWSIGAHAYGFNSNSYIHNHS